MLVRMCSGGLKQSSLPRLAVLLGACATAFACGPIEPASFRVVEVAAARAMVARGEVDVVMSGLLGLNDASPGEPDAGGAAAPRAGARGVAPVPETDDSGPRTSIPEPTERPILVVAARPELGYRSAAAVARSGRSPVLLVIASREADRRALVARAHLTEVTADGQDS